MLLVHPVNVGVHHAAVQPDPAHVLVGHHRVFADSPGASAVVVPSQIPVPVPEVGVTVYVNVPQLGILTPLHQPPRKPLETRVCQVVIATQQDRDPSQLHDVGHPLDHRFRSLHDVLRVNVEITQVTQVNLRLQAPGDVRVHVHGGLFGGDVLETPVHKGCLTDAPRAEPGPEPWEQDAVVDWCSHNHCHPLFHILQTDM